MMKSISKLAAKARQARGALVNSKIDLWQTAQELAARHAALKAQRERAAALPLPEDQAAAEVDRWLDKMSENAPFLPLGSIARGDSKQWPGLDMGANSMLPILFVTACRPLIKEAVMKHLSTGLAASGTATAEQKARLLAEIDAEIRALELTEESLHREAEAAGFNLLRREDASPEVVLAEDLDGLEP